MELGNASRLTTRLNTVANRTVTSDGVDPEGKWPLKVDESALPLGVDGGNWDFESKGPIPCLINFYLKDIISVDTVAQTFRPRLQITLDWVDDGALKKETTAYWTGGFGLKDELLADGEPTKATVWTPGFEIVNGISDTKPLSESIQLAVIRGRPVLYDYKDMAPVCASDLDVRQFPFDSQELEVVFSSTTWEDENVRFIFAENLDGPGSFHVHPNVHHHHQWLFMGCSGDVSTNIYPYQTRYDGQKGAYPHVTLRFHVKRNPWYFIVRIVSVSLLITLMEVTALLLSPDELGDRFGVTGTIFLASVAFNFVATDQVPKVSYLTRCDKWNFMNFGLVFLVGLENTIVYLSLKLGAGPSVSAIESTETWFAAIYIIAALFNSAWFIRPIFDYERARKAASLRNAIDDYPVKVQSSFGNILRT